MKKILALILALTMLTAMMSACTNNVDDETLETESSVETDSYENEEVTDSEELPNEEASEETPDAPVADTVTGAILNDVKALLGENYLPQMAIDAEVLESMYGVKAEWVEEYAAEMPMMSFRVDTFIAVKAKPEFADDVEQALIDYRTYVLENSLNYPMNLPRVEGCMTHRNGDYSFFILLGNNPDEFMDDEEKAKEAVIEVNNSVIALIDEKLA